MLKRQRQRVKSGFLERHSNGYRGDSNALFYQKSDTLLKELRELKFIQEEPYGFGTRITMKNLTLDKMRLLDDLKELLKNNAKQLRESTLTFSFYSNDKLHHFFYRPLMCCVIHKLALTMR